MARHRVARVPCVGATRAAIFRRGCSGLTVERQQRQRAVGARRECMSEALRPQDIYGLRYIDLALQQRELGAGRRGLSGGGGREGVCGAATA